MRRANSWCPILPVAVQKMRFPCLLCSASFSRKENLNVKAIICKRASEPAERNEVEVEEIKVGLVLLL